MVCRHIRVNHRFLSLVSCGPLFDAWFPIGELLLPLRRLDPLGLEAIPKLHLLFASPLGPPYVASRSLRAGSDTGWNHARKVHGSHQTWAMTPSHRTHEFRHDWSSSNHALTIGDLAACLLTHGARVSTDFSPHATVPPGLSAGRKGLRYSLRLSEAALSHGRR
jgi:hypothetical protein